MGGGYYYRSQFKHGEVSIFIIPVFGGAGLRIRVIGLPLFKPMPEVFIELESVLCANIAVFYRNN